MEIILEKDIKSGNIKPTSSCFKENFKAFKKIDLKHENTYLGYSSIVKVNSNEYNLYYRCIAENETYITNGKNLNNKNIYKVPNVPRMYTQSVTCMDKINSNLDIIHPNINIIKDENLDEIFNNAILKENCASHNLSFFYDENPNEKTKYKGIGGLVFNINEIKDFSNVTGFDNSYLENSPKDLITTKSLHENAVIISKSYSDKYRMNGLYLYESENGTNWKLRQDTPIIGGLHAGTLSMRNGYNEFDSNVCCLFWKKLNKYFLYTRSNISNGKRFIQVTTSKNLIKWSEFELIQLTPQYDFSLKENYYSYNMIEVCNGNYLLAYLPCCEYVDTNLSSVKNNKFEFYLSDDGINFTRIFEKNVIGSRLYYPASGCVKNNEIINLFQLERIHLKDFYALKEKLEKMWTMMTKHKGRNYLTYNEFILFLHVCASDKVSEFMTSEYCSDLLDIFKSKKTITFDDLIIEIFKYVMILAKYEINENELSYLYTHDNTEKYVILKNLYEFTNDVLFVNCNIESEGYVIVELLDEEYKPIRRYNRYIFNKLQSGTSVCKWNNYTKINSGKYHIKIYMRDAKLIYMNGLRKVNETKLYNSIQFTVIHFNDFHFFPGKYISVCDPQIDINIKKKEAVKKILINTGHDNIVKLKGEVKYSNNETKAVQTIKLDNGKLINVTLIDGTDIIRICNKGLILFK